MSAAGDTLGDAYINVLADTSGLGAGFEKARGIALSSATQIGGAVTDSLLTIGGALAGVVGIGMTVHSVFTGMMGAIKKGGGLYDISQQTGVAVKDLAILGQAFENAGVSASALPRTLMKMQQAIAGGKLGKLGIDTKELAGKSVTEQFELIGKSLNNIKDPAERTAAAMKVFGRSGYMLKGLFSDPDAVGKAKAGLGDMPDIMQRNAKLFDDFSDALSMFKSKMTGFWAGLVSGLTPLLKMGTKMLESFNIAAWGQKIGIIIGVIIELFKTGQIGEALWLSIKIGFTKILNYGIKIFQFLASMLEISLKAAFNTITSATFWTGVLQLIIGALAGVASGLLKILEGSKVFKTIIAAMGMGGWQKETAEFAGNNINAGLENIATGSDAKGVWKETVAAFGDAMGSEDAFSSKASEDKLSKIIDPLIDKVKKDLLGGGDASEAAKAAGGGIEKQKKDKSEVLKSVTEIQAKAQGSLFEIQKDQLEKLGEIKEAQDKTTKAIDGQDQEETLGA